MESKSQIEQIDKLKAQIDEAEALLRATQGSTARAEEEVAKQKAEVEHLKKEVERMKGNVKDEEEKRVKAVGLLKTVRQKLVKAEKERDDALKEVQSVKDRDKGELETSSWSCSSDGLRECREAGKKGRRQNSYAAADQAEA